MRSEDEMAHTLTTLRDTFGVDITPAAGLHGQELAAWLERIEDEVFEREHAELRALRSTSGPNLAMAFKVIEPDDKKT